MIRYTVMIRFGDNDFRNTFLPALKTIRDWLTYTEEWDKYKDKVLLCDLINELSPLTYRHCQLRGDSKSAAEDSVRLVDYLRVDPDMLLVDEEVDEYLSTHMNRANAAWFLIDMRIPVRDQQVFSI